MSDTDDNSWFAPKRFGYGAGFPIAWQGWALLAAYFGVIVAAIPLIEWDPVIGWGLAIPLWTLATVALILIAKRKTRGEWRWRFGDDD